MRGTLPHSINSWHFSALQQTTLHILDSHRSPADAHIRENRVAALNIDNLRAANRNALLRRRSRAIGKLHGPEVGKLHLAPSGVKILDDPLGVLPA